MHEQERSLDLVTQCPRGTRKSRLCCAVRRHHGARRHTHDDTLKIYRNTSDSSTNLIHVLPGYNDKKTQFFYITVILIDCQVALGAVAERHHVADETPSL